MFNLFLEIVVCVCVCVSPAKITKNHVWNPQATWFLLSKIQSFPSNMLSWELKATPSIAIPQKNRRY